MTEKQFTVEQINEKTNNIYLDYFKIFRADKMSFAEIVLIENVITKIQFEFNEVSEND